MKPNSWATSVGSPSIISFSPPVTVTNRVSSPIQIDEPNDAMDISPKQSPPKPSGNTPITSEELNHYEGRFTSLEKTLSSALSVLSSFGGGGNLGAGANL
jgi:hypothetical protein